MKKKVLFLIIFIFVLSGCNSAKSDIHSDLVDDVSITTKVVPDGNELPQINNTDKEVSTTVSEVVKTTKKNESLRKSSTTTTITTTKQHSTTTSVTTTVPIVSETDIKSDEKIKERENKIREIILSYRNQYLDHQIYQFDSYLWNGGIDDKEPAVGGQAFAFMLSDQLFGDVKAKRHKDFSDIRVGDVVAYLYGRAFLVVLDVNYEKNCITALCVSRGGEIMWSEKINISFLEHVSLCIWSRWE